MLSKAFRDLWKRKRRGTDNRELTIEDGKIISIVADEGEDKSTINMEYDENGRLVAQIISGMSEGQEIQIAVNMAYDERGNLIEESMSMMGMVLSKTVLNTTATISR